MKKIFEKYDYLLALILVMGAFFLFQQYATKPKEVGAKKLFVSVKVSGSTVSQDELKKIKSVVFLNSDHQSTVESIAFNPDGSYLITIDDIGLYDKEKFIFAGQHISLEQKVTLRGLINVEGTVVRLGER